MCQWAVTSLFRKMASCLFGANLLLEPMLEYHWTIGPLARYVKLLVAHAPRMPGTFYPPATTVETASWRSRHASRHVRHARAVMHVGIATPRWRGKRSRHSRRMRNPQLYVSGKRPIGNECQWNLDQNTTKYWFQYVVSRQSFCHG